MFGDCDLPENSEFQNELKLFDDSYYRIYDDDGYEAWHKRMLLMLESQKGRSPISLSRKNSIVSNLTTRKCGNLWDLQNISPVPNSKLFAGLDPAPKIENYDLNLSWGIRYLLAKIDSIGDLNEGQRNNLKSLILESKPNKSKWSNPLRIGQDKLYDGLERVLHELRTCTPHSIPFLIRVSKKDVPDYHQIIKKPMDLGTMVKKLKNQEYNSKQQFMDDLELIYTNCFTYNTAEDSIFRQHAQVLRDKWVCLMKSVPDIYIETLGGSQFTNLDSVEVSSNFDSIREDSLSSCENLHKILVEHDDLDFLLDTHLDYLSDSDSDSASKRLKIISTEPEAIDSNVDKFFKEFPTLNIIDSFIPYPDRQQSLMLKYLKENSAKRHLKSNLELEDSAYRYAITQNFVFPEILYFFNTVPDSQMWRNDSELAINGSAYDTNVACKSFLKNMALLKSIRKKRKYLLEGFQGERPAEPDFELPSISLSCKQIHSKTFARKLWQKINTLFLSQVGYEVAANPAVNTMTDLVEEFLCDFFSILNSYLSSYQKIKSLEEIIRLTLTQIGIDNLNDLDRYINEPERTYQRLSKVNDILSARIEELQDIPSPISESVEDERQVELDGELGTEDMDDDLVDDDMKILDKKAGNTVHDEITNLNDSSCSDEETVTMFETDNEN